MPEDRLDKITKLILQFRNQRNWKQFHNPKDMAISLSLEAAEFLEHFQWRTPQEIKQHLREQKRAVADELADVLYWVVLIAHDLNIDLEEAAVKKMQQNQRKYPVHKVRGHTKHSEL